jgi:hypothetical protein
MGHTGQPFSKEDGATRSVCILILQEDQPMENHIRFKDGKKPPTTGFATPHVRGVAEPDEEVNDSFGSIHPADTMDTDPDKDPEAGGKGIGEKAAE